MRSPFLLLLALFACSPAFAGRIIVVGNCDASLRKHGGLVPAPEPVIGNFARIFTAQRRWVVAKVASVSPDKIGFEVAGAVYDLELPGQAHYVDLRDPAKYPEIRHPITYGIRLGAAVRLTEEARDVLLVVKEIHLHSGRFLAEVQRGEEVEFDLLAQLTQRAGFVYSIPFDHPHIAVLP